LSKNSNYADGFVLMLFYSVRWHI